MSWLCEEYPTTLPSVGVCLLCAHYLLPTVQERQRLLAAAQDRVEQLKKEQKKRDSLASKIKVTGVPPP